MQRYRQRRRRRGIGLAWRTFSLRMVCWTLLYRFTLRSKWQWDRARKSTSAGFTLLETLVVMMIVGIIAAIASISGLSFLNTQRLIVGQDQSYQIMRLAQSRAKQEVRRWQASFRNVANQVQWAIHPVTVTLAEEDWQTIPVPIQIDPDETTLYRSREGIYRIQFDHRGNINGRLGRLTFKGLNAHKARRCVFASTLIGTLRKAKNQPRAQNGRYCY